MKFNSILSGLLCRRGWLDFHSMQGALLTTNEHIATETVAQGVANV